MSLCELMGVYVQSNENPIMCERTVIDDLLFLKQISDTHNLINQ